MLGRRENDIYGIDTLDDIKLMCEQEAKNNGQTIVFRQTNIEGELVSWIQEALGEFDAIIINPAAYTHSSIAIHDAIKAVELPLIEVHLSNIYKREEFRQKSYISTVALGVICGLGKTGYKLALNALAEHDK